jgi:hypothetical protein
MIIIKNLSLVILFLDKLSNAVFPCDLISKLGIATDTSGKILSPLEQKFSFRKKCGVNCEMSST